MLSARFPLFKSKGAISSGMYHNIGMVIQFHSAFAFKRQENYLTTTTLRYVGLPASLPIELHQITPLGCKFFSRNQIFRDSRLVIEYKASCESVIACIKSICLLYFFDKLFISRDLLYLAKSLLLCEISFMWITVPFCCYLKLDKKFF